MASNLHLFAMLILLSAERAGQTSWVVTGARAPGRDGDLGKEERGNREVSNCVESHLESIDALPLVSIEAKVSGTDVEKFWSPVISQFHMEKNKSWKSLISLISLPFLTLPSQTYSAVFHFTVSSLLKAVEKIKQHLQVWISRSHQGFALDYQELWHMLGCAN